MINSIRNKEPERDVLKALQVYGESSIGQLTKYTGKTPIDIVDSLNVLEEKGLVRLGRREKLENEGNTFVVEKTYTKI